jgi:hypothetical protein
MPNHGAALLARLNPPILPTAVAPTTSPHAGEGEASIAFVSFEALLARARTGGLRSQRMIAQRPNKAPPLGPDDLARIGAAFDLLESRGFRSGAIAYGARLLLVDVPERTILRDILAHDADRPVEVEAAVRVAAPDEPDPPAILGPPMGSASAVRLPDGVLAALDRQAADEAARDSQ